MTSEPVFSHMADCPACGGEGTVLCRYAGVAGSETTDEPCDLCRGHGWIWKDDDEDRD